jgi:hypothetical protein
MTMSADREQLAYAIKVLECYSEVMSHPGAREALDKIVLTLPRVEPRTVAYYILIFDAKTINNEGQVVWRGEYDLAICECKVAMKFCPEWQPTAGEFFREVISLYRENYTLIG